MIKKWLAIVVLFLGSFGFAQCDNSTLQIRQVRASDTDNNISWELYKHFTYFNSACNPRGILLVHLVGSYDNPLNTQVYPTLAANNGFHTLVLKYPNSTAAQSACASSANADCYLNFRKETVEGVDVSTDITVDYTNSITNRLIKLIEYMASTYSSENWGQYLVNGQIQWQKIIISGHSQGGGHAAYIAKTNHVKRCLVFASPNDFSSVSNSPANWISTISQTPDSLYYGFNNLNDDVVPFGNQFQVWSSIPMQGDTLLVDNTTDYQNQRQLYTQQNISGTGVNHSLVIRDAETPFDLQGNYLFEPVWSYMLGISTGLDVETNKKLRFKIYPNSVKNNLSILPLNDDAYTYKIFSVDGKLVSQKTNLQHTTTIDCSNYIKGVYIIQVITNEHQLTRKIVVE